MKMPPAHPALTSGQHLEFQQRNQRKLAFYALALILSIVSWWKWNIILASVASVILSAGFLVVSIFDQENILRWHGLVEYWIAAVVWVFIWISVIRNVFRNRSALKAPVSTNNFIRHICQNKGAEVSFFIIIAYIFITIEAPFIAPCNPSLQSDLRTTRLLMPFEHGYIAHQMPSSHVKQSGLEQTNNGIIENLLTKVNADLLDEEQQYISRSAIDGSGKTNIIFLLGTDNLGRDVFSRILYGIRISLLVGASATVISLLFGTTIGFLAGYARQKWLDNILMRIVDLFLAVPSLFLVIAVVAFLGNSTSLLILILAGTGWMSIARMIRGEVVMLRDREFIVVARMLGRSRVQIILQHFIPNILPTIAVATVLQLGNVILAEASLSFLGLGIQPPTPSIGNMIGESLAYIQTGWWVGIFPGIALTLFMLSVNRFSEEFHQGRNVFAGGSDD